ncbi:MAG: acylneuraminate cytidylyltransferase [Ignavibacteria bacterium]|nr:MAG: acylneuraminate cytidylyltransferase [Ignavibacteria bacterium]KAF0156532.1 MAG: acylneuraminate cytidylyltransferase [Ignavibacteria bacterium]
MSSIAPDKTTAVIIQARLGSTRLPGKVLKELCGKPILWHVWNRLSHSQNVDEIIVATTILPEDNSIQSFCEEYKIPFYRGSSNDVLRRYYEAAKKINAQTIIRVTADCPVIDPTIIGKMIETYHLGKADYLSNCITRTFPRGLDAEIFSFSVLERAHFEAVLPYEREHVTPFIYQRPELFTQKNFSNTEDISFHRWTVDTEEDYELIKFIYDSLYHKKEIFLLDDILCLFRDRPELIKLNQHIEQKKLGD